MMLSIRLHDGCFPYEKSATYAGDNTGERPLFFQWCRINLCDSLFTWYTDTNLERARKDFSPERVAWLIEPPSLSVTHYKEAYKYRREFRAVFTYIRFFLDMGKPFRFYPLGGSWIRLEHWGMHKKLYDVSILASAKKSSEGQVLRHVIARDYPRIDRFGEGFGLPVASKIAALRNHRFSVVVESWRGDYYFSEKLIDCLCMGTIPIYWGCPSIGKFFDPEGILSFKTLAELKYILSIAGRREYEKRLKHVEKNIEIAKQYRCAEDWLFMNEKEYLR